MAATRIANARRPAAVSKEEKLFQDFRATPAQMDDEAVEEIERIFVQPLRINLSAGLAAMKKSGAALIEMVDRTRDSALVLATIAECAEIAERDLRHLAELMQRAKSRARVALCNRADMHELLAEAKRGFVKNGPEASNE